MNARDVRLRGECVRALERASVQAFSRAPGLYEIPPEAVLAGLRHGLMHAAIECPSLTDDVRASLYASLLALRATRAEDPRRLALSHDRHARHLRGAFYTPLPLATLLLDAALDPLLARCATASSPEHALLSLRVLDPACGTGNLLHAVATRIAAALAKHRPGTRVEALVAEVSRRVLWGVDRDPTALALARAALPEVPASRWWAADALSLDLAGESGFDLIVGNPPFQNVIDGARGAIRGPSLGGTADLAYHFLAWSLAHRAPDGYVAMIQPRALLSAPSARAVRAAMESVGVAMVYAPDRSDFFDGARAMVCAVAAGPSGCTRVDRAEVPEFKHFREATLSADNWWRSLRGGDARATKRAEGGFEVRASMTTSEAYALRAAVIDAHDGAGPRLVTTGLIEPGAIRWGARVCRYLGARLDAPRINVEGLHGDRWARRAALWRRPKVLVAGLASRVEAAFDMDGSAAGAVGTWTLTHPTDDRAALARLTEVLNGDAATEALEDELGATRMGKGSITLTRVFLESLVG